jgi:flagellar protein FlbD
MISLTRLNGTSLWLNPLLIELVEATPDSVITLTNGHKYLIRESPSDISKLVIRFYSEIGLIGNADRQKGESD